MAYTKHTWVNGQAPAINATRLNEMETGIKTANDTADAVASSFNSFKGTGGAFKALEITVSELSDTVSNITDTVGTYKALNTSSATDKDAAAGTQYDLASLSLSAGVWVVTARARFTPSASGNHYSSISLNMSSGSSNYMDRRYGSGTISIQHSMTSIVNLTSGGTIYLGATQNVDGTWTKTSSAAFALRAVRIA